MPGVSRSSVQLLQPWRCSCSWALWWAAHCWRCMEETPSLSDSPPSKCQVVCLVLGCVQVDAPPASPPIQQPLDWLQWEHLQEFDKDFAGPPASHSPGSVPLKFPAAQSSKHSSSFTRESKSFECTKAPTECLLVWIKELIITGGGKGGDKGGTINELITMWEMYIHK